MGGKKDHHGSGYHRSAWSLSRIGWALADARVRLQNAKIATFGERAEDVFYITDSKNCPLQPEALESLRRRVSKSIDES